MTSVRLGVKSRADREAQIQSDDVFHIPLIFMSDDFDGWVNSNFDKIQDCN